MFLFDMGGMGLLVNVGGSIDFGFNFNVDIFAVNAGGNINFIDVNGFIIGIVNGVSGINVGGNVSFIIVDFDDFLCMTILELMVLLEICLNDCEIFVEVFNV